MVETGQDGCPLLDNRGTPSQLKAWWQVLLLIFIVWNCLEIDPCFVVQFIHHVSDHLLKVMCCMKLVACWFVHPLLQCLRCFSRLYWVIFSIWIHVGSFWDCIVHPTRDLKSYWLNICGALCLYSRLIFFFPCDSSSPTVFNHLLFSMYCYFLA